MRNRIPVNTVQVPYKEVLDRITKRVVNIAEKNIVSIFITGSYARGDAKDTSDFDIWIILEDINYEILNRIGLQIHDVSQDYDVIINPQCLGKDELYKTHFRNWTEESVKVLDAVLLFGEDLFKNKASKLELEQIYKTYLVDVLMGVRHYITVNKPKEKLTYKRLETYILKPMLFPLRMERYCTTGTYPVGKEDLYESCSGKMREVIEYSLNSKKLEYEIELDHKKVLSNIYEAIDSILK